MITGFIGDPACGYCDEGFVATRKGPGGGYEAVTVPASELFQTGQGQTSPEGISDFGIITAITCDLAR